LTGESRDELLLDREKLLHIYDETKDNPKDPVRTARGRLGPAAEFATLPPLGPATEVSDADRSAHAETPGVIRPLPSKPEN
jgi:NADH-quinone oxidoreductase subunit I